MSINKARLEQLSRHLTNIILEDEDRSEDTDAARSLAAHIFAAIEEWLEDNRVEDESEDEDEAEVEEPKP